jgi:HK97 family phage prohead protease
MKTKKFLNVGVTDFKYDTESGIFTCYGNVKNVIDHARDRTVDGCFMDSIERHKAAGTLPKMFWMHNPWDLPVGKWLEWREDAKGLWMKGKLSDTTMGRDINVLAKDGALDSFSIGYYEEDSKWNSDLGCNDILKADIVEVSWVTFACNEASQLEEIKSRISDGGVPSKSELRQILKSVPHGLSKNQIDRITGFYNPAVTEGKAIDLSVLEQSSLFK